MNNTACTYNNRSSATLNPPTIRCNKCNNDDCVVYSLGGYLLKRMTNNPISDPEWSDHLEYISRIYSDN